MIQQLSQVAEVQNRIQNSNNAKQFNAALPVNIEVTEKTHSMRYMLKIGNTSLETKSLRELQIGAKYWAQMAKSSLGSILLSRLVPQPLLMAQFAKSSWHMSGEELESLLDPKGGNPWERFRSMLAERLSMSDSRADFLFLGNMLLSLQQRVLTIPLRHENEKDSLLQMRGKRGEEGEDELEFYSIFSNLGALKGRLVALKGMQESNLYLSTLYQSTAELLKAELSELQGIAQAVISVDENIAPLYEASSSLLNVRG